MDACMDKFENALWTIYLEKFCCCCMRYYIIVDFVWFWHNISKYMRVAKMPNTFFEFLTYLIWLDYSIKMFVHMHAYRLIHDFDFVILYCVDVKMFYMYVVENDVWWHWQWKFLFLSFFFIRAQLFFACLIMKMAWSEEKYHSKSQISLNHINRSIIIK